MIQATELRIGNWYDHNGTYRQATWDTIHEVWEAQRSWCKPIPLTEEILLKCGFEKIDDDENFYMKLKFGRMLFDSDESCNCSEVFIDVCLTRVSVKYLHQLQNLYHALTGEELTINL